MRQDSRDTLRLDFTSWHEGFLYWSAGLCAILSFFSFFGILFSIAGQVPYFHGFVVLTVVLGVAAAVLGWLYSRADDTYFLHFPSRTLNYQQSGAFGFRQKKVRGFDELRAVGVDYRFESDRSGDRHQYALAFVAEDGHIIYVSDWVRDGHSELAFQAQKASQRSGIRLLDGGPNHSIEVVQQSDGRRYVTHYDRSWEVGVSWLIRVALLLWFFWWFQTDDFRRLPPEKIHPEIVQGQKSGQ